MLMRRQKVWISAGIVAALSLIVAALSFGWLPEPILHGGSGSRPQPTAQGARERPPPPGPLPEICKPWVPPPPSHRVRPSELDVKIGDEENPDGLDCWSNGMCNYKVYDNAYGYALGNLFAKTGDGHRAPHGGGVDCEGPLTADQVECHVNVMNVVFDLVEVVNLTCPGTRTCDDCCRITSRKKTFRANVPPSKTDVEKFEEEMRQNRERRYRICKGYCLYSKFEGQCSKHWGLGG